MVHSYIREHNLGRWHVPLIHSRHMALAIQKCFDWLIDWSQIIMQQTKRGPKAFSQALISPTSLNITTNYWATWLGLRQGAFICVRWQVTLCDFIQQWHSKIYTGENLSQPPPNIGKMANFMFKHFPAYYTSFETANSCDSDAFMIHNQGSSGKE